MQPLHLALAALPCPATAAAAAAARPLPQSLPAQCLQGLHLRAGVQALAWSGDNRAAAAAVTGSGSLL